MVMVMMMIILIMFTMINVAWLSELLRLLLGGQEKILKIIMSAPIKVSYCFKFQEDYHLCFLHDFLLYIEKKTEF